MQKIIIFLFLLLIGIPQNGFTEWTGPNIILQGEWGNAYNEFGLEQGDTFDYYPTLDGILGDGNIVVSDGVNQRTLVYKADGTFKEKEDWIKQEVEGGMIRYLHNKYLLGCCVQGYDANGNLWTGGDKKYALTNKEGVLISSMTERPLELGKAKSYKTGTNQYKTTITYPDITYQIVASRPIIRFFRDSKKVLYQIELYSETVNEVSINSCRIYKYSTCGKEIAVLTLPKTRYEPMPPEAANMPTWKPVPIAEYGSPVIAPNGDVYTWKRTPDKYSIIKWTWVDDANTPPPGPDAPTNFKVVPSTTGLYLTWTASPQDPGCVTGYEISRSETSGGIYSVIATVTKGILKYNDTTANAGITYYYKIRAVSGSEYSTYTSEASGKR